MTMKLNRYVSEIVSTKTEDYSPHIGRIYCNISFSWVYLINWPVQAQLHNNTYSYLIYERTTTKRGLSVTTSPLYITHKSSLFIKILLIVLYITAWVWSQDYEFAVHLVSSYLAHVVTVTNAPLFNWPKIIRPRPKSYLYEGYNVQFCWIRTDQFLLNQWR